MVQSRYRVNTSLRNASDTSLYPFRVDVDVQMADPGWAGLPTAAEKERLAAIEEKVLAVVGARAVLVAVVTALGVRRYMFYTDNAELAAELNSPLQGALGAVTFISVSEPDRDWQAYRSVLKGERRKPFGAAVLCAMLLLCGALVLHAYGSAWATGEVLVLVLLPSAAMWFRKGAEWYLDHRLWMFGSFTLLLTALLFSFVSLISLSIWVALAISVAAGAALTASVWNAQLKFWREQVPGSPRSNRQTT
jgi:hypothetical protein